MASPSFAQSSILTGKAFDAHHAPVPAVRVFLVGDGKYDSVSVTTNTAGVYRFAVPPGKYTLRIEGDTKTKPVMLKSGGITTVDLVLAEPQFFDQPQFTVAGVTDNTYRGGHGSDNVLRSSEELAKATASLASQDPAIITYELSGQPLEAVKQLQQTAEADPSERNLFNWGTELLSHRASQAAAGVFAKGIRLFPHSVRMTLGLAAATYETGAYEQAADRFFRASDLEPANPDPYLFLGRIQAHQITQLASYEQHLARFVRLMPDNALANYYYAVCIWNARQAPEAQSLLEKAILLDSRLGVAYLQLGIIHAAAAQYEPAIDNYRNAINATPQLEEAHFRLSEAYRHIGDRSRAKAELSEYRQLSNQSAEKLERERREVRQFVIALRQE